MKIMMSYSIFTSVSSRNFKNFIPLITRGVSSTSKSHQAQALDTIDRHDDFKQRIKVFIILPLNYRILTLLSESCYNSLN
jgi:hypothetical protein